eukprot:5642177-Ditylum_brightwellii.AAC.1
MSTGKAATERQFVKQYLQEYSPAWEDSPSSPTRTRTHQSPPSTPPTLLLWKKQIYSQKEFPPYMSFMNRNSNGRKSRK